jgi:hypothetical protein
LLFFIQRLTKLTGTLVARLEYELHTYALTFRSLRPFTCCDLL